MSDVNNIINEFSPWFDDLSDELAKLIIDNQVKLNYNKNEILCKQGGFASQIIFLAEGIIKVYKEHNDKNLILKFTQPGQFIGLSSLYNNGVFNYSAAAIESATVYSIDAKIISEVIMKNSTFGQKIIEQVNQNQVLFFERLISLTQKQLHGRISDAILHLSRDVYKSEKFNMLITRKDLADFCGMSTESAIRILKEFHNDKIVKIEGKNLEIISYQLLERLSEVG